MNEPTNSGTRLPAASGGEPEDVGGEPDESDAPPDPSAEELPMAMTGLASLELGIGTRSEDAVPSYVKRAQAGEARAFGELYQLHRREVARLAGRLLGPRGDLDDVVQEVFLQVFRSLPGFRGESRFTTWLHRVTVNVALMHLRAARSRPQLGPELPHETTAGDAESPMDGAARNERMRALYRLLDELSEKKRTVFILHDLEGVPAAEVAKLVGAPVLTVRTRLFYARRELYAAMAKNPALEAIGRELQAAIEGASDQ